MKRLNLTVDEHLYEDARKASFIMRKPISEILREAMKEWFINHTFGDKGELMLSKEDENDILDILENDEFENIDSIKDEMGF